MQHTQVRSVQYIVVCSFYIYYCYMNEFGAPIKLFEDSSALHS